MENKIVIQQELSPATLEAIKNLIKEALTEVQASQLEEKLLSPAEACKLFSPAISVKTLSRWTKNCKIQVYPMGGRMYYKYSEVIGAAKALKKYKVR